MRVDLQANVAPAGLGRQAPSADQPLHVRKRRERRDTERGRQQEHPRGQQVEALGGDRIGGELEPERGAGGVAAVEERRLGMGLADLADRERHGSEPVLPVGGVEPRRQGAVPGQPQPVHGQPGLVQRLREPAHGVRRVRQPVDEQHDAALRSGRHPEAAVPVALHTRRIRSAIGPEAADGGVAYRVEARRTQRPDLLEEARLLLEIGVEAVAGHGLRGLELARQPLGVPGPQFGQRARIERIAQGDREQRAQDPGDAEPDPSQQAAQATQADRAGGGGHDCGLSPKPAPGSNC